MVFHDNIVLRKQLEITTIEKNKLQLYKKDTIKVLAEMSTNLTNMKNNLDSNNTTHTQESHSNTIPTTIIPRTVSISNIPPIGQIRRIERTLPNSIPPKATIESENITTKEEEELEQQPI
jgi:hypothetical protein